MKNHCVGLRAAPLAEARVTPATASFRDLRCPSEAVFAWKLQQNALGFSLDEIRMMNHGPMGPMGL